MPRTLTKLQISEVSSVDRGAGAGVRVMLMKRDEVAKHVQGIFGDVEILKTSIDSIMADPACINKQGAIDQTIQQYRDHVQETLPQDIEKAMHSAAVAARDARPAPRSAPADPSGDDDDDDTISPQLARELGKIRSDAVSDGIMILAKNLVEGGTAQHHTQNDFIAEVHRRAQPLRDANPKLTQEQAFAKYVAGHKDGQLLMKASMLAPGDPVAAPDNAFRGSAAAPASSPAYTKLMEKTRELQKSDSSLSEAQAFNKVYTDPANRALAAADRAENRPA